MDFVVEIDLYLALFLKLISSSARVYLCVKYLNSPRIVKVLPVFMVAMRLGVDNTENMFFSP